MKGRMILYRNKVRGAFAVARRSEAGRRRWRALTTHLNGATTRLGVAEWPIGAGPSGGAAFA